MIAYEFRQGRQGLLVLPDGESVNWVLKKDLAVCDEDIVMDPIRIYNYSRNGVSAPPRDRLEVTAYSLAEKGYTVFERANAQGRRFAFAVMVDESETEMD